MTDAIKKDINNVLNRIQEEGAITSYYIVYFFAKLRQFLEYKKHPQEFAHISFFSNWILHIKLNQSAKTLKIVSEMGRLASDYHKETGKYKDHNDRVCELLGLKELRAEIREALSIVGCQKSDLFEQKISWDGFVSMLSRELVNKPLQLTKPFNKKGFDELVKKHDDLIAELKEGGFVPHEIKLVGKKDGGPIEWEITPTKDCELKDYSFTGGIYHTENESHFEK